MRKLRLGVLALLLAGATVLASALPATAAEPTARLSLFKAIENLDTGASLGDRTLWTMHAVNTVTGEEFTGDGLNGMQSRLVPPGTYRIFETGGVAGYAFFSWNCDGNVTSQPERVITIAENQQMTCTIQNNAVKSGLTLVKNVVGGAASPSLWTLEAQGPTTIRGPGNSAAVTNQPARIGTYTLSEADGPDSYTPGPWSCDARDLATGVVTPLPVTSSQVTIGLGQAVTCQITNTGGDLPHLTLVKRVLNPFNVLEVAPPTAWTLTAAGPETISGATGEDEVTAAAVASGAYTLSESGPDGYASGLWGCVDPDGSVDVVGTTVTLDETSDVTCTITNTFVGGWLTLVKEVVGSDQPASDWTLSADGPVSIDGSSGSADVTRVPLPEGDYTLSESGPAGYTASDWDCPGGGPTPGVVTIMSGLQITCTITNTLATAQITLVKNVINAGGGPLTPSDWVLNADRAGVILNGPSGSPFITYAAVLPGVYVLSEQSAAPQASGYESLGWSCVDDDGNVVSTTAVVVVAADDSVVCTVTNRWLGSTLTLAKAVAAPAGAPASPQSWTLSATDGATTIAGAMNDPGVTRAAVDPGTWTLSESGGPSGYQELGWSCSGGAFTPSSVTISPGTDVVCTALNAALLPTLTLVKTVDNANRGRAAASEFELKARGPGNAALSGPTGSESVTAFSIPPGDYIFSEDGPGGYLEQLSCLGADSWDGTTAELGFGDNVTCTFANTFVGPTLTLVKELSGDDGTGPAAPTDWILSAVGSRPFPIPRIEGATGELAVTGAPLPAGAFTLSEAATASVPAGDYDAQAWSCDGGELDGDVVTLADGEDVTCTITNLYDPGVGPGPGPDPDVDPDSGLAGTGLPAATPVFAWLGALLAAAGTALLVVSGARIRRRNAGAAGRRGQAGR